MRRRGRRVLAALCAAALACGRSPDPGAGKDPARERVLAFWRTFRAATDARMGRDCVTASRLYEEALALDPRHEDSLYYLGQCRRETGRPLEARAILERLVAVNPSSARGHLALGALLASPDPSEPLDLGVAEEHLRRAHAINGEETGPVVRLGEVLLVTDREAEAGRWFEAALRTNPKSLEAAFLAGFVAWEAGSADVARLGRRVREAAKVEGPVKGVLSEGDRKDEKRIAAPPLASPLGRILFGAPVAVVRQRGATGQEIGDPFVTGLWSEARRMRAEVAARWRAERPRTAETAAQ